MIPPDGQRASSHGENLEMLSVEKNLEIAYHKENGYLYCNWIGFQSKEMIMKSGETILQWLMVKKATKVLNDNTRVTGPWLEAAEWTAKSWFPRMEQAGLRHFARIFLP